jgi:hypothetical protein
MSRDIFLFVFYSHGTYHDYIFNAKKSPISGGIRLDGERVLFTFHLHQSRASNSSEQFGLDIIPSVSSFISVIVKDRISTGIVGVE